MTAWLPAASWAPRACSGIPRTAGSVTLARVGNEAWLDLADTGKDIAPEVLQHLFAMFRQPCSVTTRAEGGLGIGLAMVREIVELHDGRVEAGFAALAGKPTSVECLAGIIRGLLPQRP